MVGIVRKTMWLRAFCVSRQRFVMPRRENCNGIPAAVNEIILTNKSPVFRKNGRKKLLSNFETGVSRTVNGDRRRHTVRASARSLSIQFLASPEIVKHVLRGVPDRQRLACP